MIKSSSAYSILGFSGNLFLSKDGSVGACFLVTNPEPYSLDMVKLDLRHESFVRSFRNIDDGIYDQFAYANGVSICQEPMTQLLYNRKFVRMPKQITIPNGLAIV